MITKEIFLQNIYKLLIKSYSQESADLSGVPRITLTLSLEEVVEQAVMNCITNFKFSRQTQKKSKTNVLTSLQICF
jgi:hypothetical protein